MKGDTRVNALLLVFSSKKTTKYEKTSVCEKYLSNSDTDEETRTRMSYVYNLAFFGTMLVVSVHLFRHAPQANRTLMELERHSISLLI